jgi:acetolactate synthase-1/3 small subunit
MSRPEFHTFIAYVEDRPGVLNRVASLFRRRSFNIESLTVGRSDQPGVSRLTFVVKADADTARRIEANLYKLVNVVRVSDVTHERSVLRELALVKVRADAAARVQVLQLCEVFHARAVDVAPDALVLEVTGPGDKLDAFIGVMQQFGILEMVRTGALAMTRGNNEEDTEWQRSTTTATQSLG